MKPRNRHVDSSLDTVIDAEAAQWLAARMGAALSREQQQDFDAWLAADPRHRDALARAEGTWQALDLLSAYPRPANSAADADFFAGSEPKRSYVGRWVALSLASAAALTLASVLLIKFGIKAPALGPPKTVATSESQLRRLGDGSLVELKGDSQISERFSDRERRIRLLRGEAYFSVTKDASRPFIVEAGNVAVHALGTAFNVRLGDQAVDVLVTEGEVSVAPPTSRESDSTQSPLLQAGERLQVSAGSSPPLAPPVVQRLTAVEIDRELGWQASRFVFDGAPLSAVIERFNQYAIDGRRLRLALRDREIGALRISGRFHAANLDSFVELLEHSFGLGIESRDGDILIRRSDR